MSFTAGTWSGETRRSEGGRTSSEEAAITYFHKVILILFMDLLYIYIHALSLYFSLQRIQINYH